MRFFDEETGGSIPKETLVLLSIKDATVIMEALDEYVKNNPRKRNAKQLLKVMNEKWALY